MANIWVRTGNGGSDPDFLIADLGYTVVSGATWKPLSAGSAADPITAVGGQFSSRELRDSDDLYTALVSGGLEYSLDGTNLVTDPYLADIPLMEDFSDDHLNLTNGRLTLPSKVTGWVPSLPGDIFYDSDDGYLVFYDGQESKFIALSESNDVTNHHELAGLLDDDHTQYLLLSGDRARNEVTGSVDISSGTLTIPAYTDPASQISTPEAGDIALDTDDGYVVFYDGAGWKRIADYSTGIDHGTLLGLGDDDHSQYALLNGNGVRNAVTGTFDFGDGYLITPTYPTAPTLNQVNGEIAFVNGIMFVYDNSRTKWLSVDRQSILATKSNIALDVYLRVGDSVATSQSGVRAIRNGTITGISVVTDGSASWTFEVRRNDSTSPLASLAVVSATGAQSSSINVDFDEGDELQFFANTGGNQISAPVCYIEIAWRA